MKLPKYSINISNSFLFRTNCKHCGKGPCIYYEIPNAHMWFDPKRDKWFSKFNTFIDKFVKTIYWVNEAAPPQNIYHFMAQYSFPTYFKNYRPRLHRTRGTNPMVSDLEVLTCPCQASAWVYTDRSVFFRKDIVSKRAPARRRVKLQKPPKPRH